MRISLAVTVSILVVAASSAASDIYVWRDSVGVSHYTTDLANVPPEYRTDALTVAKDWARPEPPPAEVADEEPRAAPPDVKAATRALVEDAYSAGYRAGEGTAALAPMSSTTAVAPLVQNFQSVQVQQTEAETRRDHLVPVIVEPRRRRPARGNDNDSDLLRRFPPAQHAPYLQGPAGPPPVSFE